MMTTYDLDSWVRQWLLSGNRMTGDDMERLSVRLANWRAWLMRSPRYGQCASLEGNFRSPQIWYPPGPRPPEPLFADAWDITLAAATLQIRLHLVLKLRHVIQFSDKVIAEILRRELKFRAKAIDVDHIDWEAKLALLDALGTPQVTRRQRAVDRTRQIIKRTEDLMLD